MRVPVIKFMVQNSEDSANSTSIYPLPLENTNNARFEFLMSLFKKMPVFRYVMTCRLINDVTDKSVGSVDNVY